MVVKSTSYLVQQIFGQHLDNLLLNSTASNGTIDHQNIKKEEEGIYTLSPQKIPIVTF